MVRRILAIDPGTRRVGYAVLERRGAEVFLLRCGSFAGGGAGPRGLVAIHRRVASLLARWRARGFVIERAFVGRNVRSALVLAEARAAAILAAAARRLPVWQYAPSEAKAVVTGNGAASKAEVAAGVARFFGIETPPDADAADAVALGVCHLVRAG